MEGTCRICGKQSKGESFAKWVKPTFTDHDKLVDGNIACDECLFWFNEASAELMQRIGKEKPQRMRNYSHFIVCGEWIPLSKGDKMRMQELLLTRSFPEVAAIAESGQKHIVFRARRNPPGQTAGWVQFEEQSLWVEQAELRALLRDVEELYTTFSKAEIESGDYNQRRILQFGLHTWLAIEEQISKKRRSLLFKLAMFLAQKQEQNGDSQTSGTSNRLARGGLVGHQPGIQKQIPPDDLGAVSEPGEGIGNDANPESVVQLGLF